MTSKKDSSFNKKVVIIGGGTGTFTLLRGLTTLHNPELITAIPGMWDSGGSTGKLRSELGILPVGDIRQCLFGLMEDSDQQKTAIALSNDRFKDRLGPLQGHDFFNLELDLLNTIYGGLQNGIEAFRKLHQIRGAVCPITLTNIDLGSQFAEGKDLLGENNLDDRWKETDFNPKNKVEAIYLSTPAEANPAALQAIKQADIIVFPAGSLYGSILPHLLVNGVKEAVAGSQAKIFFISNLMTERGQADTLDKTSHYLGEFMYYFGYPERLDYLVVNHNGIEGEPLEFYIQKGHQKPIETDQEECQKIAPKAKIVGRPMTAYIQNQHLLRHDPIKLAEVILDPEKFVLKP